MSGTQTDLCLKCPQVIRSRQMELDRGDLARLVSRFAHAEKTGEIANLKAQAIALLKRIGYAE